MVSNQAGSKDSVHKRPIATATVGTICQLDMFLPEWMDPDDISADVTWKEMEVEKLSTDFRVHVAVEINLLTSDVVCDLDMDLLTLTHFVTFTVIC